MPFCFRLLAIGPGSPPATAGYAPSPTRVANEFGTRSIRVREPRVLVVSNLVINSTFLHLKTSHKVFMSKTVA